MARLSTLFDVMKSEFFSQSLLSFEARMVQSCCTIIAVLDDSNWNDVVRKVWLEATKSQKNRKTAAAEWKAMAYPVGKRTDPPPAALAAAKVAWMALVSRVLPSPFEDETRNK